MIPYADQLRASSESFQESMNALQQQGVTYYDDRAYQAAKRAIQNFAPELLSMSGERIAVEAELGVGLEDGDPRKYGGLAVKAILRSVQIQEIHEFIEEDGSQIELVRHDLCALLVPKYVDPDPVDIVFSGELYVPFGTVTALNPAA